MPYSKSTRIQRPRAWATTGGLYAGALAAVLVACTTATPRLTSPAPATLAAVRGLVRHPCAATTASVLDALGVPPSALRSIYYDPRVSGGERGYLQGSVSFRAKAPSTVRDVVILPISGLNIWYHSRKMARDLTEPADRLTLPFLGPQAGTHGGTGRIGPARRPRVSARGRSDGHRPLLASAAGAGRSGRPQRGP